MNILFIGDICGKIGRQTVVRLLPQLKKDLKVDLTIANAENSAHGAGITDTIIEELKTAGIDYFTLGDHAFKNKKGLEIFEKEPIIRPANFAREAPGQGHAIIEKKGHQVLLINLIGQIFMPMPFESPFHKLNEILANKSLHVDKLSAIIVDIHAEATSEKAALAHFLDGRVSAVVGTHTHVMTADQRISPQGTAFITDVGMVGAADSSLGVEFEGIIRTFLTNIKESHIIPEAGPAIFNAVLLEVDPGNKRAVKITPMRTQTEIK